ncbi:GM19450 [Drosophila sechellia]|uniref:GM19450 n=1 Tax=Drosophila sechellia TaxID=7238 RepID=B4I1R5_DROSE|nr:GM19450 [Drosophila sechellia]
MKKKRAHTHLLTHTHKCRPRAANSGKSKNQAARPQQLQRSRDAERRRGGVLGSAV